MLNISFIKPTFLIGNRKKWSFEKLYWTTKNPLVFFLKSYSLLYFLPQKWWSCTYFFLSCFWSPLKLPKPLKKGPNFGFLTLKYETRHWVGLIWKKCPVSIFAVQASDLSNWMSKQISVTFVANFKNSILSK